MLPMTVYVFRNRVRQGREGEYRAVHADMPEEFRQAMREAGIRSYGIFLRDGETISVLECDDLAATAARIAPHPAKQAWDARNGDLLEPQDGGGELFEEVFRL
jgi:L-rhamnose mutarotase